MLDDTRSSRLDNPDLRFVSIAAVISVIGVVCAISASGSACSSILDIYLAVFYFAIELGICTMLISFFMPLTLHEHYFVGRHGVCICAAASTASLGGVAMLIDYDRRCGVCVMHIVSTVLGVIGFVVVVVMFVIVARIHGPDMVRQWSVQRRRQIKFDSLMRSLATDVRLGILCRSTIEEWISYTHEYVEYRPEDYVLLEIIVSVLLKSKPESISEKPIECIKCKCPINPGELLLTGILDTYIYHRSCMLKHMTAIMNDTSQYDKRMINYLACRIKAMLDSK